MSVNQRSLDEVVLAYIEAWSTPDAAVRRELLDMSLAGRWLLYRSGLRGVGQGGACGPHRPLLERGGLRWGRSRGTDPDQQRGGPAPRDVSLLLGDGRSTGAADIGGHGLRGAGSRRSPAAHHWLLRSVSAHTGELARTPSVARRVMLLSNT